jgi:hypothetical protein
MNSRYHCNLRCYFLGNAPNWPIVILEYNSVAYIHWSSVNTLRTVLKLFKKNSENAFPLHWIENLILPQVPQTSRASHWMVMSNVSRFRQSLPFWENFCVPPQGVRAAKGISNRLCLLLNTLPSGSSWQGWRERNPTCEVTVGLRVQDGKSFRKEHPTLSIITCRILKHFITVVWQNNYMWHVRWLV